MLGKVFEYHIAALKRVYSFITRRTLGDKGHEFYSLIGFVVLHKEDALDFARYLYNIQHHAVHYEDGGWMREWRHHPSRLPESPELAAHRFKTKLYFLFKQDMVCHFDFALNFPELRIGEVFSNRERTRFYVCNMRPFTAEESEDVLGFIEDAV